HTDNPYRDPVPTVQLLHCVHAAADGGDSTFTDGFRAAAVLRGQDPAAFACLTTTPVTFAYSDAATVLRATGPMIGLDPRGRLRQIRLTGRSLAPVRLPAAQARTFYAAYRAFAERAGDPEAVVTARLSPGDCVIVDNTRILHGRTGFADRGGTGSATGRRHLQGGYADLDGLASTVAGPRRPGPGQERGGPAPRPPPPPCCPPPFPRGGARGPPGGSRCPRRRTCCGGRRWRGRAPPPRRSWRPPCCTTSAISPRRSP